MRSKNASWLNSSAAQEGFSHFISGAAIRGKSLLLEGFWQPVERFQRKLELEKRMSLSGSKSSTHKGRYDKSQTGSCLKQFLAVTLCPLRKIGWWLTLRSYLPH